MFKIIIFSRRLLDMSSAWVEATSKTTTGAEARPSIGTDAALKRRSSTVVHAFVVFNCAL